MPSYTSRRRKSIQRNAARIKKSISRDRRAVMHWAARGTKADHQKLRDHAKKVQHRVPSYVDQKVVDSIAEQGSRRHLAENAHDGTFLDGLAWVVDQIPGTGWTWIKQAVQGAMKPFRGDSITEEDELYALLLDQAYKDDPKDSLGQWQRQPEFGSNFVQVYDSVDGHRFIAVRGTKAKGSWDELAPDLQQDAGLAVGLDPDNIVGAQIARVLDNTRPGTIVDVGAHSLGTSLVAKAYNEDDDLQDRVRQTFLYNPVFSPLALTGNILDKYEADERMRFFIDLLDPVSLGDLGTAGPKNSVYRTNFSWNPIGPHDLTAWAGDYKIPDVQTTKNIEIDVPVAAETSTAGIGDAFGGGGFLDFGAEEWNAGDFGL